MPKVEGCISCEEGVPEEECPDSPRDCKHHCNHAWSHDACCYCGGSEEKGWPLLQADGSIVLTPRIS